MRVNPNASSDIYQSSSPQTPTDGTNKPPSPDVNPQPKDPFGMRQPPRPTAGRNARESNQAPAAENKTEANEPTDPEMSENTTSVITPVENDPETTGPFSSNASPLPGKPTNPSLDARENLFDRAIDAQPGIPNPAAFVNEKLKATFNQDGIKNPNSGDSRELDPEHTYLGYEKDGKVVLGGNMLEYSMTGGMEGVPDGKDPSELSFFQVQPSSKIAINEGGTTAVDPHDVQAIKLQPADVQGLSWVDDYYDSYSEALNNTFEKLPSALEGKFKLNYLRTLEQQHDAGQITSEDQRIAQRAVGLQGHERYSELSAKDVDDKPPQQDVKISPLTIDGHQAINALVMSDPKSGRTVLYLGGMKEPFHGFANKDKMWNWICNKLRNPQGAQELAAYFPDASKDMPALFQRMAKQGGANTRNLLESPDALIPSGRGLGYYEVDKNHHVLQRVVDESVESQGEIARENFDEDLKTTGGMTELTAMMTGGRGALIGLVGQDADRAFYLSRRSAADSSEERNEADYGSRPAGPEVSLARQLFKLITRRGA